MDILETWSCYPHLHACELGLVYRISSSVVDLGLLIQTSLYSQVPCVLLFEKILIQITLCIHFSLKSFWWLPNNQSCSIIREEMIINLTSQKKKICSFKMSQSWFCLFLPLCLPFAEYVYSLCGNRCDLPKKVISFHISLMFPKFIYLIKANYLAVLFWKPSQEKWMEMD